jgi:tetratricopeptide (TPR) repeat protein
MLKTTFVCACLLGSLALANDDWKTIMTQAVALETAGRYEEAKAAAKKALALAGENSMEMAASLNNLGSIHDSLGDYRKAEHYYRRAIVIWERIGNLDGLVRPLNNLATLYIATGEYARAEEMARESLRVRLERLGPDHPDVARSLNNLGSLEQSRRRYKEAEELYGKALDIFKRQPRPDNADIAQVLNNIGVLKLGRGLDAVATLEEACAKLQLARGPGHPAMVKALSNLGAAYAGAGRLAEAERTVRRGLEIGEARLPAGHPDMGEILTTYAEVLKKAGNKRESAAALKRARSIIAAAARTNGIGATVDRRAFR